MDPSQTHAARCVKISMSHSEKKSPRGRDLPNEQTLFVQTIDHLQKTKKNKESKNKDENISS